MGPVAIAVIIVAALAVAVILWYISTKNSFNQMEVKIKEAESGIDVALTKRFDMLTKLKDSVKSYIRYEEGTLTKVTELRNLPLAEKAKVAAEVDKAISNITVQAEAYPELKASETFKTLMKAIADTEEHLSAARRVYNANVSAFNRKRVTFPASLVGGKYREKDFFEAEETKRADVSMDF